MKRNTAVQHSAVVNLPSDRRRTPLPRLTRYLVLAVLVILLLLSVVAAISIVYPFKVTLPTPMYAYRYTSRPSYSVALKENPYFSEDSQPAGQTYLREFAKEVQIRFDTTSQSILSGDLSLQNRIDAHLIVRDAADPSVILLEKVTNLKPDAVFALASSQETIPSDVIVELAPFQQTAQTFLAQTGLQGQAELVIRQEADIIGNRFGQAYADRQASTVLIPLLQERFSVTTEPARAFRFLVRPVEYLFSPHRMPIVVLPFLALFFLVALVLFLTLTESRKNDRFRRELNRMLRYSRRQLFMIKDKAWEPEWCITASDYKSLVRTARKLKHPVFCHVQDDPENPAAYFYVYYGENNYCYTFKGRPAGHGRTRSAKASAAPGPMPQGSVPGSAQARPDPAQIALFDEPSSAVVPLMPETEDSPDAVLERLRRGSGQLPF